MVGQVTKRVLIKPGRRPIHARFTVVFVKHPLLKSEGVNWAFAEDVLSALVCKLLLAQIFPQMNGAADMGREEILSSGKR